MFFCLGPLVSVCFASMMDMLFGIHHTRRKHVNVSILFTFVFIVFEVGVSYLFVYHIMCCVNESVNKYSLESLGTTDYKQVTYDLSDS